MFWLIFNKFFEMKQITILFLLIVQSTIAQNSLFNQVEAKNIGPTIMSGRG